MDNGTIERDGDAFVFETESMAGQIVAHGAYHGVRQLVDKASGHDLIHPKYSALNLFRLFAMHQAMGQPRAMDRSVDFDGQGVTIRWAQTDEHLGELEGRYALAGPDAIDLTLTARVFGAYAGYELFLSSYFDPALRPFVYLKKTRYGRPESGSERVCPMVNDVFRGTVLVFPRDTHSARRCVDGRWDRAEMGAPTVQMCPVRHYSLPVACLEDEDAGRAVVFMVRADDCASISTRYHADNMADRLTPYSAFDFSLFGRDVLPGNEVRTRVRMQLVTLSETGDACLAAYEDFKEGTNR